MLKRYTAILAAVMMLSSYAVADETANPAVSTLIDLTVSAAITSGESVMPKAGGGLSPAFCQAVLQQGQGKLGLTDENATDWLVTAYGTFPEENWQSYPFEGKEPEDYTGVLILSTGPSDSEGSGAIVSGRIYHAAERISELDDTELLSLEWLG